MILRELAREVKGSGSEDEERKRNKSLRLLYNSFSLFQILYMYIVYTNTQCPQNAKDFILKARDLAIRTVVHVPTALALGCSPRAVRVSVRTKRVPPSPLLRTVRPGDREVSGLRKNLLVCLVVLHLLFPSMVQRHRSFSLFAPTIDARGESRFPGRLADLSLRRRLRRRCRLWHCSTIHRSIRPGKMKSKARRWRWTWVSGRQWFRRRYSGR